MSRTKLAVIAFASLAALCMQCAAGTALAADAPKPYYTEAPLYHLRPNPDQEETVFGDVGVSGLLINFKKGVVATVDKTRPGTPADGKFKNGQIITGVNVLAVYCNLDFPTGIGQADFYLEGVNEKDLNP